jgi:hypothetical protein
VDEILDVEACFDAAGLALGGKRMIEVYIE